MRTRENRTTAMPMTQSRPLLRYKIISSAKIMVTVAAMPFISHSRLSQTAVFFRRFGLRLGAGGVPPPPAGAGAGGVGGVGVGGVGAPGPGTGVGGVPPPGVGVAILFSFLVFLNWLG